jgi:sialate O-acetylesterase
MKKLILAITICFITLLTGAQEKALTLGPLFTDHAILQQQQAIPIWGKAAPKAKVMVTFGKTKAKAVADADGKWRTILPAQTATFEGKQLVVKAGKEQITLNDIVVGEVWVAAGQSNMEYTMQLYKTFQKPYKGEDLAAVELTKPENEKIRVFTCPRKGKGKGWQHANGESLAPASAPGYFCVKNLQDSLQVPVGVITNAIGGTQIESWFAQGNWYEKMVAPYVPYAVKGILWYQGENNCGNREREYASKFKRMTTDWRQEWGVADMPFLTVMLAPHIYSDRHHKRGVVDAEELPRFRQQQMACLDSVSNTEIIFTPDLVDDLFDIHYSYKWEVGRRLAIMALNRVYGRSELEWSGPRADNVTIVSDKKQDLLQIHFTHIANGLYKHPKGKERKSGSMLRWFEIAGKDGIWHSAMAEVKDNANVLVWSPAVKHPVQVRYLWHETAMPTDLRNSLGLCAFPFCMNIKPLK